MEICKNCGIGTEGIRFKNSNGDSIPICFDCCQREMPGYMDWRQSSTGAVLEKVRLVDDSEHWALTTSLDVGKKKVKT